MTPQPSRVRDAVAGGLGGCCAAIVGHPLDTLKTRLQTAGPGVYKGILDCGGKALAEGGLFVLYRGLFPVMVGVVPIWGLSFLGYSVGREMFCESPAVFSQQDEWTQARQTALAGAVSAAFFSPVVTPIDRIKIAQQCDATGRFSSSVLNTVRHLWAEGGVQSLYLGLASSLARNLVSATVYFSTYEYLKRRLSTAASASPAANGEAGAATTLFAGGVAGVMSWVGCLPVDTVKSRYQAAPVGQYTGAVLGARSALRHVIRTEGARGLVKGWQAVLLRAFPANAAAFYGMETARDFLTSAGM
jgi:solute carrier family 25 carnitine/acylcarnitine transporter 20/29